MYSSAGRTGVKRAEVFFPRGMCALVRGDCAVASQEKLLAKRRFFKRTFPNHIFCISRPEHHTTRRGASHWNMSSENTTRALRKLSGATTPRGLISEPVTRHPLVFTHLISSSLGLDRAQYRLHTPSTNAGLGALKSTAAAVFSGGSARGD